MPWWTQETAPDRGAMEEYTPARGDNPMVEMRGMTDEAAKRCEIVGLGEHLTGGRSPKSLTPKALQILANVIGDRVRRNSVRVNDAQLAVTVEQVGLRRMVDQIGGG